jgi:uncharacterized protein YjdB
MAYTKTTWVDNSPPAINAENLNKIENGIEDHEQRIEALEQGGGGLTDDIKQALLQIAQKVAYIDEHGQDYYDDLYDALYAVTAVSVSPTTLNFSTLGTTQQLTATTTPSGASVTWASSNTSIATVDNTGLVTSVAYGAATITATAGGITASCSVVVAQATLTSITAVYTQSDTVYDTDSLDSLKSDLVVTAHYDDSTTQTIAAADYTLSGTLTEGTSTITVSYGGKTTTFNVTVSEATPLYQLPEIAETGLMNISASLQDVDTISANKTGGNGSILNFNNDGTITLGNTPDVTWFSLNTGDTWVMRLEDITYNNATADNKFNATLRNGSNQELIKSGDISIASTGEGTIADVEASGTVTADTGNLTLMVYVHRAMEISFKFRFYVNGVWYA